MLVLLKVLRNPLTHEVALAVVLAVLGLAAAKGLTTWADVEALAEAVLEEQLYGPKVKALPDPAHIHRRAKAARRDAGLGSPPSPSAT